MIVYRIKYDKIISELYIPNIPNGHSVIILSGLPSVLYKNNLTTQLVKDGFTVYHPFYSGTFDSEGAFFPENCEKNIATFVEMAKQNSHTELYNNIQLDTSSKKIHLIGSSFGSSIACAASTNTDISSILLLSPVLSYNTKDTSVTFRKQLTALLGLLSLGFKHTYRISDFSIWERYFTTAKPYLKLNHAQTMPILILHGADDATVKPSQTVKLLKRVGNNSNILFYQLNQTGHSISDYSKPETVEIIENFFNNKLS